MRSIFGVLPFVAMTFLCWGVYGPVLHIGQHDMAVEKLTSLRPFICVGLAYFLVAVVTPIAVLISKGEAGRWTLTGLIWSFAAGIAGAVGALGIIFAFKFSGALGPVFVMPLVFGCAPVVNTFVTMWMSKNIKEAGIVFMTGVFLVAIGGFGVMFFKPGSPGSGDIASFLAIPIGALISIALTAFCWGSYGPVLHKGQMKMEGSRLRPFLCVGLAYFLVAVVVPLIILGLAPTDLLSQWNESSQQTRWNVSGTFWSLLAGGVGAVGALGIILAFNFGGKPIFVMPLVFGGAPVVNTLTMVVSKGLYADVPTMFYVSLLLVIIGAVTVLIFAPKPGKKPAEIKKEQKPQEKAVEPKTEASDDESQQSAEPFLGEEEKAKAEN
jgi:hypothetical protein